MRKPGALKRKHKKTVLRLVADCCAVRPRRLRQSTRLNNLALDSLSFVTLLAELENAFYIEFDDGDLAIGRYTKISDITRKVREKIV